MALLMVGRPVLAVDQPAGRPARELTARDLVVVRDIGPNSRIGPVSLFAISPDGRWVAYQLRQADPDANTYRLSMQVLQLAPPFAVRTVDQGGTLIRLSLDMYGKAGIETGIARPITPVWAPDGRSFAFLKRAEGIIQVWRAFVDGRAAEQLTHEPVDVEEFALTETGSAVVVQTRPALAKARRQIAREALTGFHVDERWTPIGPLLPYPAATLVRHVAVLELSSGAKRPATEADVALLTSPPQSAEVRFRRELVQARIADVAGSLIAQRLVVRPVATDASACQASACRGRLEGPWPAADGRSILYLRQEGWAEATTTLYRWQPGAGAPRPLYSTADLLESCAAWKEGLLCIAQGSTSPRHFRYIDARRRRASVIHDPNPGFAQLALGKVSREHWRNAQGQQVIGDLVLPVGYRQGRRYPAIVVLYETRGFLRGGTGDEFPIQLFANRGFAVLSVQNPRHVGLDRARDYIDGDRIGLQGFALRESVLSAVETGVRRLVARGIVDPALVGIAGLSDGSSTVQYAAVNSHAFSAGIVSGCCWTTEQDALLGSEVAAIYHQIGWPRLIDDREDFWRRVSLVRSGSRFPLLFQAPEDEFRASLTSYAALRQRGTPAEMFVYPDEHHVKWQPAHRLAVYERDLAWFDYWLRDIVPVDPAWKRQLSAWNSYKRVTRGAQTFPAPPVPVSPSAPPSSRPRGAGADAHDQVPAEGQTALAPVLSRAAR